MQGIRGRKEERLFVERGIWYPDGHSPKLRGVVLSAPFIRGWEDTTEMMNLEIHDEMMKMQNHISEELRHHRQQR